MTLLQTLRSATLTIALTTIAIGCNDTSEPEDESVFGESFYTANRLRTYVLRLPTGHNASQPTPLLIAFHGNPDTGEFFEQRTGLTEPASDAGFIIVYPDGLEYTWGPWDWNIASDLIAHMAENVAIDSSRIYITGYSAGGTRMQIIICDHSDLFAAAVSVGATLERATYSTCDLPQPIPILFVHGTEDTAFPWDGAVSGSRERYSVAGTLLRFGMMNGCVGDPVVDTLPDLVDDSTWVWTERWTDCDANAEVMLYGISGGGHTWPSGPGPFPPGRITQEISSDEIIEFFQGHTLGVN